MEKWYLIQNNWWVLEKSLNGYFNIDVDDYHPQSNKDMMKNGIPLTDDDRIHWLETLRDALIVRSVNGATVISWMLCFKGVQRNFRHAHASYVRGSYMCIFKFVLLEVGDGILGARLEKRAAYGQPAKLLESQLDFLQIDESQTT